MIPTFTLNWITVKKAAERTLLLEDEIMQAVSTGLIESKLMRIGRMAFTLVPASAVDDLAKSLQQAIADPQERLPPGIFSTPCSHVPF